MKRLLYGIVGIAIGGFIGFVLGHILAVMAVALYAPNHPNAQLGHDITQVPIYFPVFRATIFLAVLVSILVTVVFPLLREQQKQTDEEKARRQQSDLNHRAEQASIRSRLATLNAESVKLAESLPKLIQTAKTALDRAEFEFKEGAYIPFWDAIQIAVTKLANFECSCNRIAQNTQAYRRQLPNLDAPKPTFELDNHAFPDAKGVADRMQRIIRPADKDPNYTMIYLMCKENRILVEGFSTLGEAIYVVGNRLESSIFGAQDELQQIRAQMDEHADAQLGMLDNIQRRKKPRD